MDLLVTLTVILSFATLMTTHVAIVAGLVARRPRWRALVALVVVPLAPYWGYREQMRKRAILWTVALAGYGIAFVVAHTSGR